MVAGSHTLTVIIYVGCLVIGLYDYVMDFWTTMLDFEPKFWIFGLNCILMATNIGLHHGMIYYLLMDIVLLS